MERYYLSHLGGSRFCYWLLAFTHLAGVMASELTIFMPSWRLGHVFEQDAVNVHAPQCCVQHHARAVYVLYSPFRLAT